MSASSDARLPGSPYDDLPVRPGEIRLVTIEKTIEISSWDIQSWKEMIGRTMFRRRPAFHLVLTRHKLEDKPAFVAVSYVWGTAPATTNVVCNGKQIQVTATVQAMLEHLQRYNQPLWVDAICIDQQNEPEKATQIPLMRHIYSQCLQCMVWLGDCPLLATNFMIKFPVVFKLAKDWKGSMVPRSGRKKHWRGDDWPSRGHRFWVGLYWLLNHEWFKRLWTFQEVVLAPDFEMVAGARSINGVQLCTFVSKGHLEMGGYLPYEPRVASKVPGNPRKSELGWAACYVINLYRADMLKAGVALQSLWQVLELSILLRPREVKEPVDRIWATIGLLPDKLQDRLTTIVDYSGDGRREYWRTYVKFAKLIVEMESSLWILDFPKTLERNKEKFPSWCADLAGKIAARPFVIRSWNLPASGQPNTAYSLTTTERDVEESKARRAAIDAHPAKLVACSEHDNSLRVRGFVTDRISAVVGEPEIAQWSMDYVSNAEWADWTMGNPKHATNMDVYARAVALAQKVYHGHHSDSSNIPIEFLMCVFTDHRVSTKTIQGYRDAYSIFMDGGLDLHRSLNEHRRPIASECMNTLRDLTGYYFFATEGGRFGIASPFVKPGDTICSLYGGSPLYILRWLEGKIGTNEKTHEAGNVEFCGIAYVPHLMEQHQREAARLADDEIFVIA
jgi:hypothetical protein